MKAAKQNQKFPFHFLSAPPTPPAENLKKGRKIFGFCPRESASAAEARSSAIGAYLSDSSHHARGACEINRFAIGNECELGTINTPKWNLAFFSKVFQKPKCGTREARPNDSRLNFRQNPPKMNPNSARLRALFFRQEAGAKSEAILTHSICFDAKRIFGSLYFLSYCFCTHYQLINKNI